MPAWTGGSAPWPSRTLTMPSTDRFDEELQQVDEARTGPVAGSAGNGAEQVVLCPPDRVDEDRGVDRRRRPTRSSLWDLDPSKASCFSAQENSSEGDPSPQACPHHLWRGAEPDGRGNGRRLVPERRGAQTRPGCRSRRARSRPSHGACFTETAG